MIEFNSSYCGSKAYTHAVDKWKVPLAKKAAKRERKAQNPPKIIEDSDLGQMYVHNEDSGVSLPQHPDQIFAVMNVKGTQYKVIRDDRVIIDDLGLDFQVGQ